MSQRSPRTGKVNLLAGCGWRRSLLLALVVVLLLMPGAALAAPEAAHTDRVASTAPGLALAVPAEEQVARTASVVHLVRRGETLNLIARRYGSSVAAIMSANGLRNANRIYSGQRLVIPGRSTTPAPAPATGKWIDINLSRQRLTAYQGNRAVFSAVISSGTRAHPTVVGRFSVRSKVRSQAMSGPGYYLPGVPYVMYFYGGYAIHGTYWHNNFGRPMSHGCINMTISQAAWLYSWAPMGTSVVTHY